jgi:acyl dehydratase
LFISFHSDDGTWSEPVNMESVLGDLPAALARISPDGEILFFTANGDVYWIHTDALDALRQES